MLESPNNTISFAVTLDAHAFAAADTTRAHPQPQPTTTITTTTQTQPQHNKADPPSADDTTTSANAEARADTGLAEGDETYIGSMLFTRCVSGVRVVRKNKVSTTAVCAEYHVMWVAVLVVVSAVRSHTALS